MIKHFPPLNKSLISRFIPDRFKNRPSIGLRLKMQISFGLPFVLILIIVLLVELYGLPFTDFNGEYGAHKSEAFRHLSLTADIKKNRLLRWIKERIEDTRILSEDISLRRRITKLNFIFGTRAVNNGKDARFLTDRLNQIKDSYGFYNRIQIIQAKTGIIMASTQPTDIGLNVSRSGYFTRTLASADFYVCIEREKKEQSGPFLHISQTIRRVQNRTNLDFGIIAVAVFYIDPEKLIKPMLHTGEGLGQSGEVLLVNQNGMVLTKLKNKTIEGTRAIPLAYHIKTKPAQLAAQGFEGLVSSIDYRGIPVLAAYRHILISTDRGWGMVVKKDQEEVFRPLRQRIWHFVIIGGSGILFIMVLTVIIANNLSRPLRLLSETSQRVEAGDLNARAKVFVSDETGRLAVTFNSMIEKLQKWHEDLENQVKIRTLQFEEKNKELKIEIAERKRAEESLRTSEEQFRSIAETAVNGIITINDRGMITFWNKEATKIFGYETYEATGRNITIIIPERFINTHEEALARVATGAPLKQRGQPFKMMGSKKDGTEIPVELSIARWSVKEDYFFSCIIQDISERKYNEEKIKQLSIQLMNSQEEERQRVARELHDSVGQTMLAAKLNFTVFKQNPERFPERYNKGLELIDMASRELREIYTDLFPSVLKHLGLPAAIRWFARNYLEASGITTEFNLLELEHQSDELEINLYRIIQESFSNIVKHSGADRVKIDLFQDENNQVILWVEDNGIGFSLAEMERRPEGSGLTNIRQRIENLGGRLNIQRAKEGGTMLHIFVPR